LKNELHPKSWTPPTERGAVFMTKYSKDEKIAAIEAVKGGESIAQVAKQKQISKSVLKRLVRSYSEHGEKGLHSHTYNWKAEQKNDVLKYMHENQLSFSETGVLFGIRDSTILHWERRYLENGIEGLEDKKKGRKPRVQKPKPPKTREEELLDRIQYLEAENAYLKKLNALVAEREKHERGNG
jgi:transposase-like protein